MGHAEDMKEFYEELRLESMARPQVTVTSKKIVDWAPITEDALLHPNQGQLPGLEDDRPRVSHYQAGSIEPIDFINSQEFNFNLGNAVKYISRCDYKGTKRKDLEKAIDYIRFELEMNCEE